MVAKGSRAWPARSVFVSNFTRLPVRVPLPSLPLSFRGGGGGRAGSIFAARRPVQRDKSLINAVDRLDVIKFPLVRGFRLRKRSPTAGETSFEGDPILLSTPLLSSPDFSRGRGGTTDPHRWIFSRRETALCRIRLIYEFLFSSFVYFRDRSNSKKLVGVENRRGSREGKFAMIRWRVKRKLWFIIQRDLDKFILRSSSSFESYAVSRHLKFENN